MLPNVDTLINDTNPHHQHKANNDGEIKSIEALLLFAQT